jgi:hypothetical protein
MFMLRKGGKFTESQIDHHFSEVLRVCIIGAAIFIVVGIVGFPKIGLLAAILVVCSAKGSFRRFESWSKGKRGETLVAEALKSLSDKYVLLNDLTLPDGKGNVDHLVIAPNGLFVIETKKYSGRVKCEGDQWFVNGRPTNSVSRQAKRNAMAVRNHLGNIFVERQKKLPFVNAVVVFVEPNGRLNLNQPTVPVLRSDELAEFIRNYRASSQIAQDTIRAIVHHMHHLQRQSGKILRRHEQQTARLLRPRTSYSP